MSFQAALAWGAPEPPLPEQLAVAEESADLPAVAEICRRLVAADTGDARALRRLVRVSVELGDIEGARLALADLKARAGAEDADVLEAEGDLRLREDKPDEAVAKWQAALQHGEAKAGLLAKLGDHFLHTERNPETAALYFERLLGVRANAADHIVVAEAAAARRDWTTVIARTTALKADFAADNSAKRAVPALERLLDSTLRIARLDKRIDAGKAPVPVILERGILFREIGFPELGLVDARRALKMVPDALYVRVAYAVIAAPVWREHERLRGWNIEPFAFRSRMPDASFLERLTKLEAPLRSHPRDGERLRERAALLLGENQASLALADLDAALAADPEDAEALRIKAAALRAQGKFGLAVSLLERALALKPENPEILRAGVDLLVAQGEYARAIELCDVLIARSTVDRGKVIEQRALCYERLQKPVPPAP